MNTISEAMKCIDTVPQEASFFFEIKATYLSKKEIPRTTHICKGGKNKDMRRLMDYK